MRIAIYGVGAQAVPWPFPVHAGGPPTAPGVYVFDTQHLLPAERVGFDLVLHVVYRRRPASAAPAAPDGAVYGVYS